MQTICDSIAVKILPNNKIIQAIGNEIHMIFKSSKQQNKRSVWRKKFKEKIHGFKYEQNFKYLLVYGGKSFMLLRHNNCDIQEVDIDEEFQLICHGKLTDWISNAIFSLDENQFYLLTAHSTLLLIQICQIKKTFTIVEKYSCTDKSTLYCSHLMYLDSNDLMVFGGNAFGEIIIWSLSVRDNNKQNSVLRRISGHQGVVFSIDVNIKYNLMITTSDDRSVRFWKIENIRGVNDWKNTEVVLYKSGYGHTARVFKSQIFIEEDHLFAISVGEDSNMCIWNSSGELIFKRRHHFGATIWNFEYDIPSSTLFSTGSDSNLVKYSLRDIIESYRKRGSVAIFEQGQIQSLRVDNFVKCQMYFRLGELFDIEWNFVGITQDCHIVIDAAGVKIREKLNLQLCTLLQVITTEVGDVYIYVAGYKYLCVYLHNRDNEVTKYFELSTATSFIKSLCDVHSGILLCDDKGFCEYIYSFFSQFQQPPHKHITFQLPFSKERWITAATKIDEWFFVCGRQGHIFLYQDESGIINLKFTLKNIHGNFGITHIFCLNRFDKNRFSLGYFLRTCSRDGTIKTLKFNPDSKSFLKVINTKYVPVTWIDKFSYEKLTCNDKLKNDSSDTNSLVVTGFNDNHFVVWKENSDIIASVPCGGGHRQSVTFIYEEFIYFSFSKDKHLHAYKIPLQNKSSFDLNTIEMQKFHVKSCNVMIKLGNTGPFVSGGEDNKLKFFSKSYSKDFYEIRSHISSVKCIKAIIKDENKYGSEYLVFSCGGRAQICVTKFKSFEPDWENEEKCKYMMKLSDFERKYHGNSQKIDFDPEMRILSIDLYEDAKNYNILDIFIACSDGYIRKLNYKNNTISLCSESLFYGKCILHVKILKLKNIQLIVSAATDGFICFWELKTFNPNSKSLLKIKHHESGVNSLDIRISTNDDIYLASGGDDQNVVVSILKVKETKDNTIELLKNFSFNFLHIAQVNGVQFSENLKFLYTVGIDQRVCKIDLENMKLTQETITCVSDIKGLLVFQEDNCECIVYGCGMQTISFKEEFV